MIEFIEQFSFYLFLIVIPFQTRKFLWQQNWYFNEWQAIFVYGTDIILLILFAFWLSSHKIKSSLQSSPASPRLGRGRAVFSLQNFKRLSINQLKNPSFYLFSFVIISVVSLKNAISPAIGLYQLGRLIEFIIFYVYIKNYAIKKFDFNKSIIALAFGGLIQGVIAIAQFLKQSSLGFKYFGESIIGNQLNGVAIFINSTGQKIIRAYGTTPHPNILAAYFLLAIFSFYYLWFRSSVLGRRSLAIGYSLILFGFFSTFSRTIIFFWVLSSLAMIYFIINKFKKNLWLNLASRKKLFSIILVTLFICSLFSLIFWPDVQSRLHLKTQDEAVQLRIFYDKQAAGAFNYFGIGTGNFVNWLISKNLNISRELYQPVHNIYLLIYSENGIFGLVAFLLFIFFLIFGFIRKTKLKTMRQYGYLVLFLSILAVGFFDHFLWTLQQGRFIFWLSAALLAAEI